MPHVTFIHYPLTHSSLFKRTEWDRYLSPEGTPAPLCLLDPPPPSTAQWAQYCVTENSEPKTPKL